MTKTEVEQILRGVACDHERMTECHPGCGHWSCSCGLIWDDGWGYFSPNDYRPAPRYARLLERAIANKFAEQRRNSNMNGTENESPLALAIRQQLQQMLEQPLTPKSVQRIAKMLEAGRDALIAINPEFAFRPKLHQRFGMINNPTNGYEPDEDSSEFGAVSEQGESYGARAIREIVGALTASQQQPAALDPVSLVIAIKHARESGLEDVAKKLEAKLEAPTNPALEQVKAFAAASNAAVPTKPSSIDPHDVVPVCVPVKVSGGAS